MATPVDSLPEFPVSSLLPRKETGVITFLSKYPKYDGTGVVIAIFDSGVDPAAAGLQVTSSGSVKVLDRLDGSGAGDVDTSVVVHAAPGRTIIGVSGRTLTIPDSINNPSGEYHLGVKSAYSLYPGKLKDRIVKERKEQMFEPHIKKLQEEAMRRLQQEKLKSAAAASSSSTSPTEDGDVSLNDGGGGASEQCTMEAESESATVPPTNGCGSTGTLLPDGSAPSTSEYSSFLEKQQKEEAESEVALLATLHKKYQDLGPAYDCIVYNDGRCWRAIIDTTEVGDLSRGVDIGEYRITHEWKPLTPRDSYTVTINVHNSGNLLEIVGMCSNHGTHVASIASACFPNDPERNGVAPGAQIVSITIGDNRVHGMETGTAVSRAMSWVMDNPFYKVDVINMSYGEHSHTSLAGRLGELASDVVNKYGVVWISSASNHGPALTTIGTPPDFNTDSIIGIGAYISPDMMKAGYSFMDKLPGTAYTWSSRGPTADGGRGVSVCAPGGAITSMPAFTNKTSQLMNGTSMAAPHAAGCVALLMSGLKAQSLWYSPYTVRRCLQNTALPLAVDPFVQGHGLIQVEKAFDYLTTHCVVRRPENNMRFIVECGAKGHKGIYLRNWRANKTTDISVSVEPLQFDDARADDNEKRSLNLDLVLLCDAEWVCYPEYLHLSYTNRSFVVRINPAGLQRGQVYFTSIRVYVAAAPEMGALFEVPITVVMPIVDLDHGYLYKGTPDVYRAGCVKRVFIRVPSGATWVHFHIKSSNSDQNQRVTLHAVQLAPQSSVLTYDHYKTFSCLYPHELSSSAFPVYGGLTLEVCVARWWAALHDTTIEYTVSFHGLKPSNDVINMYTNNSIHRIDVTAGIRSEDLWPQAVVKQHCQSLLPYESRVEVLGRLRDTIPGSRPVYQLVLCYTFTLPKNAEVQPKCGLLNEYLYESPVESQLWMLFDSKKQHLGSGDAYSHKYSIKLEKGDYVIRQHVRHEKTELLEKLLEMPMTIITKLSQEVKLDVFSSFHAALTGSKKTLSTVAQHGDTVPLFFTTPNLQEKAFKSLNLGVGNYLQGTITFAKEELARRAVTYPLRVVVTENLGCKKRVPGFATENGGEPGGKKEPRTQAEYSDALRDLQITWINKLDNEGSDSLYRDVCQQHPNFLPAHVARLQAIDAHYNVATSPPSSSNCATSSKDAAATSTKDATSTDGGGAKSPVSGGGDSTPSDLVVVEVEEASTASWVESVKEVAGGVQSCVDFPALLAALGTKMDTRADAAKYKSQMERQKVAIIEAYCKQGIALAHPYLPALMNPHAPQPPTEEEAPPQCPPDAVLNELDIIATSILKLVEPSDCKVTSFFACYYQVRRLYATAARLLLQRTLDDRFARDTTLRLATLYRLLGYHHIASDVCRALPIRFPAKYTLF